MMALPFYALGSARLEGGGLAVLAPFTASFRGNALVGADEVEPRSPAFSPRPVEEGAANAFGFTKLDDGQRFVG
jgi:hypothetical protein